MSAKSAILVLLFASIFSMVNAQTVSVADKLMESGKLNAVIVVAGIILLGIFLFLFYLERKIKRLEDEVKNK